MLKRTLYVIVLMSIIGFGLVIAIPFSVLSFSFSSYDSIDKTLVYEYLSDSPSDGESLYLNIDYGNVIIDYIDPPVDYLVKIEVNIRMGGAGLVGKEYSDYYNIIKGDLTSSPINFTMKLSPGITETVVETLTKSVSVIVTLQKGIIFDIFAELFRGNFKITVPFNVEINSIKVNNTFGEIVYILENCILGGNITGETTQGDVILQSYNTRYIRNSFWYLKSIEDEILFDIRIDQSIEMGANITGYGESLENHATIMYYDDVSTVGAWIKTKDLTSGSYSDFEHYFNEDGWTPNYNSDSGYEFVSNDFPAVSNYNISIKCYAYYLFYKWNLYNKPT
ncbi:MAG: hypothetical protein EAX91_08605 [Candidatus Lokiarchaeota archaeon]|nr:hypothetical protein [Candidatus Lokiarchaeota archaeon]